MVALNDPHLVLKTTEREIPGCLTIKVSLYPVCYCLTSGLIDVELVGLCYLVQSYNAFLDVALALLFCKSCRCCCLFSSRAFNVDWFLLQVCLVALVIDLTLLKDRPRTQRPGPLVQA